MFLACITAIVGKLFGMLPEKKVAAVSVAPTPQVQEVDTALLAAITAAARTVIDKPFAVRSVAPIKGNTAWSNEGRRQIQSTRRVR